MESITIRDAWTWLLAAAAAIVALSKAWDVILKRLRPHQDAGRRLDTVERRLAEQDRANTVIFRALYAQINHDLSGNGNEILRKSRDEIQEYLTNR